MLLALVFYATCVVPPRRTARTLRALARQDIELRSLRELLALLPPPLRARRGAVPPAPAVTVVLNVFHRVSSFPAVLDAVLQQSASDEVGHVLVVALGTPCLDALRTQLERYRARRGAAPVSLVSSSPAFNPGYFGRFQVAMHAPTPYILFLDDDIVLGRRYLELCLRLARASASDAVLGQRGARYFRAAPSANKYHDYLGEHALLRRADVLFSGWFMRSEWVRVMFEREPVTWRTSEDMHLAYTLRERLGVESLALPADPSLPEYAMDSRPSLGQTRRSWSEWRGGVASLRDHVLHTLRGREERERRPASRISARRAANGTSVTLTRKDLLADAMPIGEGARAVRVATAAHAVALSHFACRTRSIDRLCETLPYRQPLFGVAKSYFGGEHAGLRADNAYWRRRNARSYRLHVGYELVRAPAANRGDDDGDVVIDGVVYGAPATRLRIYRNRRQLVYNATLSAAPSVVPPVRLRGATTHSIAVVFTDAAAACLGHQRAQRNVHDELRFTYRPAAPAPAPAAPPPPPPTACRSHHAAECKVVHKLD